MSGPPSALCWRCCARLAGPYYLRFDVERLRCCALDVEDVLERAGAGERGA